MGYCMDQVNSQFRIERKNFGKALLAIKALAGAETVTDGSGRHFSWVNNEYLGAETLAEAIDAWRWHAEVDGDAGDIIDISFRGEKYGDDDAFFKAIAPFVAKGSFIEMRGEEGACWRWFFDGYTVHEQSGHVVYDEAL